MKLSILIVLLSLFAVSVSAQQADTTAAPAKQPVDTAAVVASPPQATPPPPASQPGKNRRWHLGAGAHYMETLGDVKDAEEFESSALNLVAAAKVSLGLIKLEVDSEWVLDYGGSDHTLWIPQVFALVGGLIYGGVGIGSGYINQEWFDQPIYTLRAGVNFPLGPVSVDVNANYQFMKSEALEGLDSEDLDSVTFGALIWF